MKKDHHWEYCILCDCMMVVCGTCGNNSCNGTYGTLPDGSTCPDCPSAYDKQNTEEAPSLPVNHEEVSKKYRDLSFEDRLNGEIVDNIECQLVWPVCITVIPAPENGMTFLPAVANVEGVAKLSEDPEG